MSDIKRVAVLGAGGLGRNMTRLLDFKKSLKLVAICDTEGYAYSANGLSSSELFDHLPPGQTVGDVKVVGHRADDPLHQVLAHAGNGDIDGIFLALPNLPNEFIPDIIDHIIASGYKGVVVDALKRTSAMEMVFDRRQALASAGITYITGCGATPGLLTAAASLAAQSFVEVEDVTIWFGVGVANWEAYRATIREDIAHLANFDVNKVNAMTDAEIEVELESRNGLLELVNMEHADDIMLEKAGILHRGKVKVGGLVDTRNPNKPVSTSVKVTGLTFEGKRGTHTFTLGDETSMAANVNGPALGYMNAGFWLNSQGIKGLFTSADLMPRYPA